ncbi:MAG: hypothetical protein IJI37_02765 [Opitutales bacterium]|nr:hypothetical protein [Opitutales bacterium]
MRMRSDFFAMPLKSNPALFVSEARILFFMVVVRIWRATVLIFKIHYCKKTFKKIFCGKRRFIAALTETIMRYTKFFFSAL